MSFLDQIARIADAIDNRWDAKTGNIPVSPDSLKAHFNQVNRLYETCLDLQENRAQNIADAKEYFDLSHDGNEYKALRKQLNPARKAAEQDLKSQISVRNYYNLIALVAPYLEDGNDIKAHVETTLHQTLDNAETGLTNYKDRYDHNIRIIKGLNTLGMG